MATVIHAYLCLLPTKVQELTQTEQYQGESTQTNVAFSVPTSRLKFNAESYTIGWVDPEI